MGGTGWGRGRGGRETQRGDQGLSVISCSKHIDNLVGPTMRCIEGPWSRLEVSIRKEDPSLKDYWFVSSLYMSSFGYI